MSARNVVIWKFNEAWKICSQRSLLMSTKCILVAGSGPQALATRVTIELLERLHDMVVSQRKWSERAREKAHVFYGLALKSHSIISTILLVMQISPLQCGRKSHMGGEYQKEEISGDCSEAGNHFSPWENLSRDLSKRCFCPILSCPSFWNYNYNYTYIRQYVIPFHFISK